jgi:hypothetical protein
MTSEITITRAPIVAPWRDPQSLTKAEIVSTIATLKEACLANPQSADLRTFLGMAHAMNFDVYSSMDALEEARTLDPTSFWAQLKYAELHYRLRTLNKAETESLSALNLAQDPLEAAIARKLLGEIRRLKRDGTQKPEWAKSLRAPAFLLLAFAVVIALTMVLR